MGVGYPRRLSAFQFKMQSMFKGDVTTPPAINVKQLIQYNGYDFFLGRRLIEINAKKREAKLTENNAFLSHLQVVHGLKNQVVPLIIFHCGIKPSKYRVYTSYHLSITFSFK